MYDKHNHSIILLLLCACTTIVYEDDPLSLRPCDPSVSSSESSSSTGDESSSSSESSSESTGGITLTCPTIANGTIQFCVDGYTCRNALFYNVNNATGSGPLAIGWVGTFEWPGAVTGSGWSPYAEIRSMAQNQGGVAVFPQPDPAAIARENFPWWPVCSDQSNPALQCDRDDDFVLAQAIQQCALEQGLADPDRVVMGGMSAGGILLSRLLAHDAGADLAAAVVWSGGVEAEFRPTVMTGTPGVFVLHGGPTDVYPQGCNPNNAGCHSFVEPNEELSDDVNAAITCNHGYGHSAGMPVQGAEFMQVARRGVTHPWTGYPVGSGGWVPFSGMSNGSMWVLRNDCDPFP